MIWCHLINNSAYYGAAFYAYDSNLVVDNCLLESNNAIEGAIFISHFFKIFVTQLWFGSNRYRRKKWFGSDNQ